MQGTFFIISAPSGAGKTSMIKAILSSLTGIDVSVSYTTRSPRPGEVDGQDYHFISHEDFIQYQRDDFFLESAKVFTELYGTSKARIDGFIKKNRMLYLRLIGRERSKLKPIFLWRFGFLLRRHL